jgi:metallo-beta-lactamase family protein
MNITFLGGVGTVTGSKYLLANGNARTLIDCGLFQGFKQLRLRNWASFPIDPASINDVVLTHAHLDHSGYLPLLVKNGFAGRVLCTEATAELCKILLPDSGFLLEKDAEFANRHGFSKHHPALPLYTRKDAEACLARLSPVPFGVSRPIAGGASVTFLPAGHILGAAIVRIVGGGRTVVFSGDLGRPHSATMVDPAIISHADYLLVESTYGDRLHERRDPEDALAEVINRTAARGGTVVIPAFAVGRTQALLHHLARLNAARRIPQLPIFLDSPMAVSASDVFCDFRKDHKLSPVQCRAACEVAHYVRDVEESKSLDEGAMPKIIISASGMATGGRVLHHLKVFLPDPRNTILLTGFQAGGTRGAALEAGVKEVKIHGQYVPVRAEVVNLHMLSAHADADEILAWLRHFKSSPRRTFVTHGEPAPADTLRRRIEGDLGWTCAVPEQGEKVELQ